MNRFLFQVATSLLTLAAVSAFAADPNPSARAATAAQVRAAASRTTFVSPATLPEGVSVGVSNYFVAGGVTNLLASNRLLYVDSASGSDTLGTGTLALPFRTAFDVTGPTTTTGAVTHATSGDTIVLRPGVHTCPYIILPNGVNLLAEPGAVIVRSNSIAYSIGIPDLAANGPMIWPGNNSVLDFTGATIIATNASADAAFGWLGDAGAPAYPWLTTNSPTGVIVYNGHWIGSSDNWYIYGTNSVLTVYGGRFRSGWDNFRVYRGVTLNTYGLDVYTTNTYSSPATAFSRAVFIGDVTGNGVQWTDQGSSIGSGGGTNANNPVRLVGSNSVATFNNTTLYKFGAGDDIGLSTDAVRSQVRGNFLAGSNFVFGASLADSNGVDSVRLNARHLRDGRGFTSLHFQNRTLTDEAGSLNFAWSNNLVAFNAHDFVADPTSKFVGNGSGLTNVTEAVARSAGHGTNLVSHTALYVDTAKLTDSSGKLAAELGFVGNGHSLLDLNPNALTTNTAYTADLPTTNGGNGNFPLAIVGYTNGVAKWEKRPKVYRALLSQTDMEDPIATVLENSLGGIVVWDRVDAGAYSATLAGAFPASKTIVIVGPLLSGNANVCFDCWALAQPDSVSISSDAVDGLLVSSLVEILVYP